jgi:hypothetical protein
VEHDEDVEHGRAVRWVLLHAEQPQMDALDHLALRLRALAIQGRVHDLQRGASDPVVPHLITQDKIIYLGHASSSTSIRCF